MSIIEITDSIKYFSAPVNIGVISLGQDTFLIDTGIDNTSVNKVLKSIEKEVTKVLLTHHHSDHIGGCKKFQGTKVLVYGPTEELGLIHTPILESYMLFGGNPFLALRSKTFLSRPCKQAIPFTKLNNSNIGIISLPGHTIDHKGVLIESVLFAGDSLFPEELIQKHRILFMSEPEKALETYRTIGDLSPSVVIPGHGRHVEGKASIHDLVNLNKEHVIAVRNAILEEVREKKGIDEVIVATLKRFINMEEMKSIGMRFLFEHVIKGYLSWLERENKVKFELDKGVVKVRLT